MSGQLGPIKRGRVWDPLVRLFHWSLAAAFATAWFERSEAAIHETAGMAVLVLVIIRAAWGLVGPVSARFETFIKGPTATAAYVFSIVRGKPAHFLGHNPAGAAMIAALLLSLTATAASGILMMTTALWGNAWIEWIHGTAATVTVWLIAGHLAGVLLASIQHRENLPLAMLTGRKWVAKRTRAYLGASMFTPLRLAAAFAIILTSALAWVGSTALLNASLWRMNKIVTAEAAKMGCEVQDVTGPRLEIYPEINLRYELAVARQTEKLEAVVSGSLAMQRRPVIDVSALAAECAAPKISSSAASTYSMPPMSAVKLPTPKSPAKVNKVESDAIRPPTTFAKPPANSEITPTQQQASVTAEPRQPASRSLPQTGISAKTAPLPKANNPTATAVNELTSPSKPTLKKKRKRKGDDGGNRGKSGKSRGGNSGRGSSNSGKGGGNSGHGGD